MSLADLSSFEMRRVPNLEELCALLTQRVESSEETVLLAGGTDWVVEQEMAGPRAAGEALPLVVDVSRLDELRGITVVEDRMRIGAATTYWEMRQNEDVCKRLPLLERMARDVGAVQIQGRGTLGGNLATASPAADGVAVLAALDVDVVVRSTRGERTIPFSALQTGYKTSTRADDEVIVAVEIDLLPEGTPWIWRKVGTRRAQAISKVALAGVAVVADGRCSLVGLGMASVAPVTARMSKTRVLGMSTALSEMTGEAIDRAVDADVRPIDDVRSNGAYRAHAARAVTRAFFRQLGADV